MNFCHQDTQGVGLGYYGLSQPFNLILTLVISRPSQDGIHQLVKLFVGLWPAIILTLAANQPPPNGGEEVPRRGTDRGADNVRITDGTPNVGTEVGGAAPL